MSSVPRHRLGIIGAGGIVTNVHLPVLLSMPAVDVLWVFDVDRRRAQRVASNYQIPQAIGALAEAPDVDAVLIATPVATRVRVVAEAIARGWNALCEKPFATSATDHAALISLARRRGVRLGVGLVRRAYASTMLAAAMLEADLIGDIERVAAADGGRVHSTGRGSDWYQGDPAAAGGGVLIETGTHIVDQLMAVSASTSMRVTRASVTVIGGLDIDAAVDAEILIRKRWVPARIEVSRSRDVFNGVALRSARGELRVGVLPSDPVHVVVNGRTFSSMPAEGPRDLVASFRAQWRGFLENVGGPASALETETGLPVTTFIEDAYRTASRASST